MSMVTSTSSIPRRACTGASEGDGRSGNPARVLALVLPEDPGVLTLPALAGQVLVDPCSLTAGVSLARAIRELDDEGLV